MTNVANSNEDSSLDDPTPGGVVGLANAYNSANGLLKVIEKTSKAADAEVEGEEKDLAMKVQSGGEKDEVIDVDDSGEDEVVDEEEEEDGDYDKDSDADEEEKPAKKKIWS